MYDSTTLAQDAPSGEIALQDLQRFGICEAEVLRYYGEALAARVETDYMRGFNTALRLAAKGKSEEEVSDLIQDGCPHPRVQHFFVKGYKRGLAAWKDRQDAHESFFR